MPSKFSSMMPPIVQLCNELAKTAQGSLEGSQSKKNTVELIKDAGYEAEEYKVVTEDGYKLTMHRIVRDQTPNKPVVFLQHGLLCSSSDWVLEKKKSLGFLLADLGYDVWMGNFRGNTYSKDHVDLDPELEPFWQFSYDQMGQFDLPAMLAIVLGKTGQDDIIFVGHSMGTTAFWIMINKMPWMNSKVRLMIGLAPVTTATLHTFNLLHLVVPIADTLGALGGLIGINEFGGKDSIVNYFSGRLDLSGTSIRTLLHFAQGIRTGKFSHYEFRSEKENLDNYGTKTAPDYNMEKVTCPVVLYWGENDWLSQPEGVSNLSKLLPNLVQCFRVPDENWSHLDFLLATDVDKILNKSLITVMTGYTEWGRGSRE